MNAQRPYQDVLADAVRVLTEAARRTTSIDFDGRQRRQPADFAEFLTHAVAGAAANIGGVEEILTGRSGSWEAEQVRQLLHSTVGYYEEHLLDYRTEPLNVVVAVDNLLTDIGFAQLFEQAHDELDRREEAICAAVYTDQPMPAVSDLPDEQQAALEEIDRLRDTLDQLRAHDWTAYGEAFKNNVLQAAVEILPRLPVPLVVHVLLDWQDDNGAADPPCGPAYAVWERARDVTPLPGCGIPLQQYPVGDVTQIEREAGRDPLSRIQREEASR